MARSDLEALEHGGEVLARESPVEGPRRQVVALLEATKAVRQLLVEVTEVGRLDDLVLDDGEHDLDLALISRIPA